MTGVLTRQGTIEHRGHSVWWGAADAVRGDDVRDGLPVLTIHGGPGICHDCLEPLTELASARSVVFYDQYGCGLSDRAADPAEYTVDLFLEELSVVRAKLGLANVHLFAHSYGGPLALEYLLSQPEGVASLIISNSFASVPALAQGWQRRLDELPPSSAAALRAPEPDPEVYGPALGEFIERFVLPFAPPEPLIRSQLGSGAEVYAHMHGSSWFVPDGEWSQWDATTRLHEITVPTLVIGGTRDQCVPALSEAMAERLSDAELVIFDSAHLPFYEIPEEYLSTIASFLRRVETTDRVMADDNLRMTTPIELLSQWFAAHAGGDLRAARALVADDVDIVVPGARLRGFDAFMQWYGERAAANGPSFRYVVDDICGGKTHACAVLALSTDERSWRQVAVYEVMDGRIVSIWAAEDAE